MIWWVCVIKPLKHHCPLNYTGYLCFPGENWDIGYHLYNLSAHRAHSTEGYLRDPHFQLFLPIWDDWAEWACYGPHQLSSIIFWDPGRPFSFTMPTPEWYSLRNLDGSNPNDIQEVIKDLTILPGSREEWGWVLDGWIFLGDIHDVVLCVWYFILLTVNFPVWLGDGQPINYLKKMKKKNIPKFQSLYLFFLP